MKREISYKWIFNIFLLRIFESVNFCSRVSSREAFWRGIYWKQECYLNIYFIFVRIVSNALTAQTIFMVFLCCWKLPLHLYLPIICIYQIYFKDYFCFNPVDFRQLYICIIAFLLSNLSRGKLPISYFLLTEAHYEPCFTF